MAQTEHVPIYTAAYDLCLYLEQIVRNFARYHKYSVGQDLWDGTRRTLRLIVRADAIDADQWALNTPNGTIDLRTGALLASRSVSP
jgi:hypothetical protein